MRRRLSELVDAVAFDPDGLPMGRVADVRLVQDGPYIEGFGHGLRIDGIVIAARSIGIRLGFGRARVRGPWPLSAVFRWLESHADYYTWDDVDEWADGAVRLKPGATPSQPPE